MYDIEFFIPADTDVPHIVTRLQDFKKYGIWNVDDYKIRLVFGTNKGNKAEWLLEGWNKNIDAVLFPTPYKHVAQRTYHYYDVFLDPNNALWYSRIDEDSMTDIRSVMSNLDLYFDPERDYHICGPCTGDVHDVDVKILSSMGLRHVFHPLSSHEHEISITSHTAMKKIMNNPLSKKYFTMRKLFAEGYGDQGLALAARINKIYITPTFWLEHKPWLDCFSGFGGHLSHIHWTGRDKHPQIYNWQDLLETDQSSANTYDGEYVYTKIKNENEAETLWLKLENRLIKHVHSDKKVGIFGITKDQKLTIFMQDWASYPDLLVFERQAEKLVYKNHELTKIS